MKKLFLALMAVAAIALTGCKDENDVPQPQPQPQDGVIQITHQLGERVKNPTNADWCKAPKAEQTLLSLRRISDRLYYMDFVTDLTLQKLVEAKLRTNKEVCGMMNELWFHPDGYEEPFDEENPNQTPACSGFVCFNEAGELLFGRNFDGAGGPMCMVFNTANGTHDYVQLTAPNYNSALYNGTSHKRENGDGILSDDTTSLHRLLRQPVATMDGMNEYGLCFGAFQLPVFRADNDTNYRHGPRRVMQDSGKNVINSSLMHNLILSECKTVKDVEKYMRGLDFAATHPSLNVHWMVADATGDYAVFEYWEDSLYVLRAKDRNNIVHLTSHVVPYEYNSIENYYCNPYATATYLIDKWQNMYSSKVRVNHLMMSYRPVMDEMEALRCLQAGSFGVEMLGDVTNWSCVYNPKQRTILFCMRNDMSKIYKLDLKKELKEPSDYGTPQPPKPQGRDTIPY